MIHLLKRAALACAFFLASFGASTALAQDIYSATATTLASTTPTYSSGDVVGGLLTFSDMARSGGGAGMLQSIVVNWKSNQNAAVDFFWCGASNIPSTTLSDNAAVALATADFASCRAWPVTNCTSAGTPTSCALDNLAFPYKLTGGSTAYGFVVVRGAMTLASTSDLSVTLSAFRN